MRYCVFLFLFLFSFSFSNGVRDGIRCSKTTWTKTIGERCLCQPCYLCESKWKWFSYKCQVMKNIKLDDGNHDPQQPEISAQNWFLNEIEMVATRGGLDRHPLSLYTEGNNVKGFIDGNQTFDSMYKDISETGRTATKDYVYITSWCMDNAIFRPAKMPSDLKYLLKEAASRGVNTLSLIWQNFLSLFRIVEMVKYINEDLRQIAPPGTRNEAYIDARVKGLSGSHHQKTMIVKKENQLIAYVGGIDPCYDRWDTWQHNSSLRKDLKHDLVELHGWVDESQRIIGPASKDVLHNFVQRWNDPEPLSLSEKVKSFFGQKNLHPLPISKEDNNISEETDVNTNSENSSGKQSVQIVRTYGCNYNGYKDFAPSGEISMFSSRLKAIRLAKNYIYIQDQYFIFVPEFVTALLEVLPRLQRLIIVVQRPDMWIKATGYESYQFDMIKPLMEAYPNKIQFYTMKNELIYVHSKTLIIDDIFVSIGSGNWNQRSMTSDTELGANVIDTEISTSIDNIQVNNYARKLRNKMWAEIAAVPPEELNGKTIIEAANAIDEAVDKGTSAIERYELDHKIYFAFYGRFTQGLVDSDGRCNKGIIDAKTQCSDKNWLPKQSEALQAICKCILLDLPPNHAQCDDVKHYVTTKHEAAVVYAERKQLAIVLVPVLCVVLIAITILIIAFLRWRKRRTQMDTSNNTYNCHV